MWHAAKRMVHKIVRLRTMFPGIIAALPLRASQATKSAAMTPAPTKRPMMVAEFQGSSFPPLFMANRNMNTVGVNMPQPTRSKLKIRSVMPFPGRGVVAERNI